MTRRGSPSRLAAVAIHAALAPALVAADPPARTAAPTPTITPAPATAVRPPPRAVAEAHGACASVTAERGSLLSSERLRVEVALDTPPEVEGSLPEIGDALGPWHVCGWAPRETRRNAAGGLTRAADLVLEPALPGEYEIPALEFRVRAPGQRSDRVLRTPPLAVRVDSVLDPADASPQIAAERGMIEPDRSRPFLWLALGAGATVALLAAGGTVAIVRSRRRTPAPAPAPWKIARLGLERALVRAEWDVGAATTSLDDAAAALAGWVREQRPGGAALDEAGRLETDLERLRFSGSAADPREARRLGEEVMRVTRPSSPAPQAPPPPPAAASARDPAHDASPEGAA